MITRSKKGGDLLVGPDPSQSKATKKKKQIPEAEKKKKEAAKKKRRAKAEKIVRDALPSQRDDQKPRPTNHPNTLPPSFSHRSELQNSASKVPVPGRLKEATGRDSLAVPEIRSPKAKKQKTHDVTGENKPSNSGGASIGQGITTGDIENDNHGGTPAIEHGARINRDDTDGSKNTDECNHGDKAVERAAVEEKHDDADKEDASERRPGEENTIEKVVKETSIADTKKALFKTPEKEGVADHVKDAILLSSSEPSETKRDKNVLFDFQRGKDHYLFTKDDMRRLRKDDTAINDTLIDFFVYLFERKNMMNVDDKHLYVFKTLFYLHLEKEADFGNRSQANLHAKRGFNIFEYDNLLLPVFNGSAWHFATCIIANHAAVLPSSGVKDGSDLLSCILSLDPKQMGLLKHQTILTWLNQEYQIYSGCDEEPYTKESMPMYVVSLPDQEGSWECGYLLCLFVALAYRALKNRRVLKSDRERKFARLSRMFYHNMADVQKLKLSLFKSAINRVTNHATKLQFIRGLKKGEKKAKKGAEKKGAEKTKTLKHHGLGAATPARKKKVGELEDEGAKKKRVRRKVGSEPETDAQCKDKYVRTQLARVSTDLGAKLWPMSTMPPTTSAAPTDSGTFFFFGAVDFMRGNGERVPFESLSAKREVPRITIHHPSNDTYKTIMDAFAANTKDASVVEAVHAPTTADLIKAIHGTVGQQFPKTQDGDAQLKIKGNKDLEARLGYDSEDDETEDEDTNLQFVAKP